MNARFLPSLLAGFFVVLSTGCETVPANPVAAQPQRTQAVVNAPRERVWPLIVAEVGLEYPVRAIEKESGLLTTDWVTIPAGFNNMESAKWIIPPGGFLATWAGLRMNMKVMATEPERGKTLVNIVCHYEAFENNVRKTWLVASSNGTVENAILTRIEKKAAAIPPQTEADKSPAGGATPQSSKSAGDSLIELKKLLDAGAITPAEYETKKKAALERL